MNKTKSCYPRTNKNGEIISYRFFYTGRNPVTNQPKQYTHTWKVPKGLSHKQVELERKKAEIEFIKESEKKSNGTFIQETNITFGEYSKQWLERILKRNEEAYSYYVRSEYSLQVINEYFGNCLLRQINPSMVQRFYDYLCERTYTKEVITVKKSILELVEPKEINKTKLAAECGIDRLTLRIASTVGEKVRKTTAQAISKHFGVPLTKYFNVEKQEVKYSKSTNMGIRTILVIVLGEAKREQLIEHNYASKEYTRPLTGVVKEKEIYDEQETLDFVQAILNEPHPKKRPILALSIFLGLRKAEICGLSWSDINLEQKTLSINHNRIYFRKFGVITKGTKTENSKRTLALPDQLVTILSDYKSWYDEQKILHGDLWENTDSLFLQDNGKPMNPCTVNSWVNKFELNHGFKHIPPHSLRHTSITMQLKAGVPIKAVSTRAGHANENITLSIYTHLLKEQDEQAADTFDRFLIPTKNK